MIRTCRCTCTWTCTLCNTLTKTTIEHNQWCKGYLLIAECSTPILIQATSWSSDPRSHTIRRQSTLYMHVHVHVLVSSVHVHVHVHVLASSGIICTCTSVICTCRVHVHVWGAYLYMYMYGTYLYMYTHVQWTSSNCSITAAMTWQSQQDYTYSTGSYSTQSNGTCRHTTSTKTLQYILIWCLHFTICRHVPVFSFHYGLFVDCVVEFQV